jgi:hypothetical protein
VGQRWRREEDGQRILELVGREEKGKGVGGKKGVWPELCLTDFSFNSRTLKNLIL